MRLGSFTTTQFIRQCSAEEINSLTSLRSLELSGRAGVTDLSQLTGLTELSLSDNDCQVKGVSQLVNLQILEVISSGALNQLDLNQLTRLTELDLSVNHAITDVNCLTGLQSLNICGECGVADQGIARLTNLTRLNCIDNPKITMAGLRHLTAIKTLYRCDDNDSASF